MYGLSGVHTMCVVTCYAPQSCCKFLEGTHYLSVIHTFIGARYKSDIIGGCRKRSGATRMNRDMDCLIGEEKWE